MEHVNKVEILKALADDVRLGAVRALARAGGPVPGCEIVGSCAMSTKLSQPAMSHHFNKLVDAGVVSEEKRGTQNSTSSTRRC